MQKQPNDFILFFRENINKSLLFKFELINETTLLISPLDDKVSHVTKTNGSGFALFDKLMIETIMKSESLGNVIFGYDVFHGSDYENSYVTEKDFTFDRLRNILICHVSMRIPLCLFMSDDYNFSSKFIRTDIEFNRNYIYEPIPFVKTQCERLKTEFRGTSLLKFRNGEFKLVECDKGVLKMRKLTMIIGGFKDSVLDGFRRITSDSSIDRNALFQEMESLVIPSKNWYYLRSHNLTLRKLGLRSKLTIVGCFDEV